MDGKEEKVLRAKNVELEKEIAQKSRELEIETSLEKVRVIALGMTEPADMLKICRTICEQLQTLGVNEIRNVQTAIIYESKGLYVNYEYYRLHDKALITEVTDIHPVQAAFISQMLNGPGSFFTTSFTGAEVKEWLEYQKTTNVFIDTYLAEASSLNYYWYSLGPVALGMSTYAALSDDDLEVFKRFRNVFDLAYRRYLDVEQAIAQAREAQIEAALEKVRSRSLAMHKSDELQEVVGAVFEKLSELNIDMDSVDILIPAQDTKAVVHWIAVSGRLYSASVYVPYFENPINDDFWDAKENGTVFFAKTYSRKEKNHYFNSVFENSNFKHVPDDRKREILEGKYFTGSWAITKNACILIISYSKQQFLENENEILKRFAKVFDQAYTRFLDLQKAEAQAREGQIQLALERVRARTMAMQRSDELAETATVLFQQLNSLDIIPERVFVCIPIEGTRKIDIWGTEQGGNQISTRFEADADATYSFRKAFKAWEEKKSECTILLEGKDLAEHINYVASILNIPIRMELVLEHRMLHCAYFSRGILVIVTPEVQSEQTLNILQRFAGIFDQTYTRFLDLQKAEMQARESKIEAALERVRGRTMAMFKSDELAETAVVVFKQLIDLGIEPNRLYIAIINDDSGELEFWITDEDGNKVSKRYNVSIHKNISIKQMYEGWKDKRKSLTIDIQGEQLMQWLAYWNSEFGVPFKDGAGKQRRVQNIAYFSNGFIAIASREDQPEETRLLLDRFSSVFNLTYTRFLDLQKAETQAREAKIEAALEKVRSRSLAMHKTDELAETAGLLFRQLELLNVVGIDDRIAISIIDEETGDAGVWITKPGGDEKPATYHLPMKELKYYDSKYLQWKERPLSQRKDFLLFNQIEGDELAEFFDFIGRYTDFAQDRITEHMPEKLTQFDAFFSHGVLTITGTNKPEDSSRLILKRFAAVFEQTYIRFLDLQKAEAQAKESQIQLALERVRARTMAMQHSEELADAANLLFHQVQALEIPAWSCGYNIWEKDAKICTGWMSSQGLIQPPFQIPLTEHPTFIRFYKSRQKGEDFYVEKMEGTELAAHYKYMLSLPAFAEIANKQIKAGLALPVSQINHVANFSHGNLIFLADNPVPEAHDIFKRFAAVFEQTYTRFLDLQKAEAQAREAKIETSLERVRAAAMAMHDSNDVGNATALVFSELYKLGITTIRCGVCIIDGATQQMEVWSASSSQEGAINRGIGKLDMTAHPLWIHLWNAWKQKKSYFVYELAGKELADYYKAIINAPDYRVPIDNALHRLIDNTGNMKQYCNIFLFNEGCVFTFTQAPFSPEINQVLEKFTSVFGLTYRRFLDLKKAEAQARESQIEVALERVRSKTMAMHNSSDVGDAMTTMFEQLLRLGIETTTRCGVGIIDETKHVKVWTAYYSADGKVGLADGRIDMMSHSMLQGAYYSWKNKELHSTYTLSGQDQKDYYAAINNDDYPTHFDIDSLPEKQYQNAFYFPEGFIYVFSPEQLTSETVSIFKRFAGVYGLTYRRFLDLQRAEAQAKEAQIQLALERVRARTMAMHRSDELAETAVVLFQQLSELGDDPSRISIGIPDEGKGAVNFWATDQEGDQINISFVAKLTEQTTISKMYKAWKEKTKSVSIDLSGSELAEWVRFCREEMGIVIKDDLLKERRIHTIACFSHGWINYTTHEPPPLETIVVLERFAAMFSHTYTRFLDLQKAEAQAKEAQIELGLERVRARAMAMQTTEELNALVGTVFEELTKLDFVLTRCLIMIFDPQTLGSRWWMANSETPANPMNFFVQNHDSPAYNSYVKAWRGRLMAWQYELKGKVKRDWDSFLFVDTELSHLPAAVIKGMTEPDKVLLSAVFNNFGCLTLVSLKPLSSEHSDIMLRFAKVFDMSYTRFNDLKQAEAQAREAQIEASLERVRSKTMAMYNSHDVGDTVATMFDELVKLGVEKSVRCGVGIIDHTKHMELWTATNQDGHFGLIIGRVDMTIHPMLEAAYTAWKNKESFLSYLLEGSDRDSYFKALISSPEYRTPYTLETIPERQINSIFFFPEGCLFAFTTEPMSTEMTQLFKRFTGVFGLTYRRFLDLQKAEAQSRESQIEAALERVRGRAMAMHNSKDLSSAANTVFIELRKLGITPIRCGVGLLNKSSRKGLLYSATTSSENDALALIGWVQLSGHPVLEKIYDTWLDHKNYFPVLNGEELKTYYELLLAGLHVPSVPDSAGGEIQYGHFLPFPEGCLYAWSDKPYTDSEVKILDRFKGIISLTFRRYFELQQSETNARDAIREASLDRVRAEIASMRTTDDLERITPLIWNELTVLGVPFIRCGVFIMDEQAELIHTYLSTPDGKALAAFQLQFNSDTVWENLLINWQKKQIFVTHWNEEEFAAYTKNLVEQGAIGSDEKYVTEHPTISLDLHFFPFLQGMIYVGNIAPLIEEETTLVQSLASAFSTAYARYEDFNKLEAAKQQVENTLTELKAAQTRLIQSEKMASLGELTAGIAHEIQNPLNFVNNFSEVNQEMIDEMEEEIKSGNFEDALAIAAAIKQNEQKINHHGKRADGIVKGMLQHSRSSSGEKQLTNINTLAEEFMHLSYHGLRAKDKTFNTEMITHFDADLPKINVIAQDIGRVFLNLFNNAFYAVSQKQKSADANYKPEVTVITSSDSGHVFIKVKDNGIGIPDAIKDKIMQPFFTTKPTGEGTGLGLSLSYDIVIKGHGGSIVVDTREGEFTEFIVQLPVK